MLRLHTARLFLGRSLKNNPQGKGLSSLESTILYTKERDTLVFPKHSSGGLFSLFSTHSKKKQLQKTQTKRNGAHETNSKLASQQKGDNNLGDWTKEEVQAWFSSSVDFKEFSSRFPLSGKLLAGLTKEDYQKEIGNIQGSALYNAVQELNTTLETIIQRVLKRVRTIDVLNNTSEIPLLERNEQIEKVLAIVRNNISKISGPQISHGAITGKAKTDLVIPAIIGGSGIGKTRLGYEAAQELFKPEQWKRVATTQFENAHTLYLYMDFANGNRLDDNDENLSPGNILAIRLAFAYFVVKKGLHWDFPSFYDECLDSISQFTIQRVFRAIRADLNLTKDIPLFVVLHLDEVQYIFQFENRYKFPSGGKGIFKDLIYEACQFFAAGSVTIQPIISGTAHRRVMASKEPTMYSLEYIHTPLLSLEATFKLVEHYATQFGANPWEWKMHLPFLQLLSDMGGLPRAISYLVEECFGRDYSRGSEFFQQISSRSLSLYHIFLKVADSVSAKYGLEGFLAPSERGGHRRAAIEVLSHAIRGARVTRDSVLGDLSVEEMEYRGYVFLHQVETQYYFNMPFLFVHLYNKYLEIIPDELAAVAFIHGRKVNWQDWESFNAVFQVFLNNLLCKQRKTDLPLGDFYNKADGHNDTKNLLITLNHLKMISLRHQFPSKKNPVVCKDFGKEIDWTTGKYLLLNGKSAVFGDTVLPRVADKQSAQKYFGRPVNLIIISGQQKWDYNGEYFTLEQAVEEHTNALKTAQNAGLLDTCGLITVIFTTQPLPKDKIQSIPKDILIVHQGNFKDFYGPFAARAAFSVAQDLNPNFADLQHLEALEGVGTVTAKEIAQERQKQPFKNLDDLCARVPSVKKGKLTRELSFFPFTSKHLLLPFEGYTKQNE